MQPKLGLTGLSKNMVQAELQKAVGGGRDISLRMTICGCPAAEGRGVKCDHSNPSLRAWGHILAPLDPQPVDKFHGCSRRPRKPVKGHLGRKIVLFFP